MRYSKLLKTTPCLTYSIFLHFLLSSSREFSAYVTVENNAGWFVDPNEAINYAIL